MNDRFNYINDNAETGDDSANMPELDGLLRDWHAENMDAAQAGRDRLLAALQSSDVVTLAEVGENPESILGNDRDNGRSTLHVGRHAANRLRNWGAFAAKFSPAAAAILLIAVLIAFNPSRQRRTHADVIYAPDGGALTALDDEGRVKGPYPLKDTFVDVDISGRFARVTLWQTFHNPYHEKIEAVYTFPMGHNGAVDRMTMSIGDRIIVGEVHEREEAKQIYETAKQQGHVAALLEQERPNIFTQSVANIVPGAEILVEISYVETITPSDGVCEFAFPMTVAPRYIPSNDAKPLGDAGRFAKPRDGVNLLAPGDLKDIESESQIEESRLWELFNIAIPVDIKDASAWETDVDGKVTTEVATFVADYEGIADERGAIYSNGTGYVGNRWFAFDRGYLQPGTRAVPDAARITPPAAAPGTRAGHDISIGVAIDTGGPGIIDLETPLHATIVKDEAFDANGLPTRCTIDLADVADIPNRDFVLRWRPVTEEITDSVLTHTSDLGNFVTIMIDPPARVAADDLVPRELVFVIDTSGSMKGDPLAKAKQVMANALESMGPNDTFNVIAFSDDATRLWDSPREATIENIDEAHIFVARHDSNGGTEMMNAVRMALATDDANKPTTLSDLAKVYDAINLDELAQSSADGRFVVVRLDPKDLLPLHPESDSDPYTAAIKFADESTLYVRGLRQPVDSLQPSKPLMLMGSLHSDADGYDYIELDEFGPAKQPGGTIKPAGLSKLPADDRRVSVLVKCKDVDGYTDRATGEWIEGVRTSDDDFVVFDGFQIHDHDDASAMLLTGRWAGGEDPRFVVEAGIHVPREWTESSPLRVVCFLTDGEVGNDMSIIEEIRRTAGHTRFFSMGIGNSVNRYLLDGMAAAGRGAGDVITLEDDAHAVVERFVQRMRSPVLLNPTIEFSDGLDIVDMQPAALPDLFDERPIVIHAKYELPGTGTITIRGDGADGAFERTLDVELPEYEPRNTALPSLWAREKVDSIMNRDLRAVQQNAFPEEWRQEVIDIGESFQIMTQYTSFVAVEQFRVTLGGEPTRIHVPVEPPDGTTPESEVARQLIVNAAGYAAWPEQVERQIAGERYLMYQQAAQAALDQARTEDMLETFPDDEDDDPADSADWSYRESISEDFTNQQAISSTRESQRIALIHETKERQIRELMDRAEALRKESRIDESIQVLDQVLVIQPDHEQGRWMRDTLGDLQQSIRDRDAISARPEIALRRQSEDELEFRLGQQASPKELEGSMLSSLLLQVDGEDEDIDAGVPVLGDLPQLEVQTSASAGTVAISQFQSRQASTAIIGANDEGAYSAVGAAGSLGVLGDLEKYGGRRGGAMFQGFDGAPDEPLSPSPVGGSQSVELWTTVVRDSNATPKHFVCPSTTDSAEPANDYSYNYEDQRWMDSVTAYARSAVPAQQHYAYGLQATPQTNREGRTALLQDKAGDPATFGVAFTPAVAGEAASFGRRARFCLDSGESNSRHDLIVDNETGKLIICGPAESVDVLENLLQDFMSQPDESVGRGPDHDGTSTATTNLAGARLLTDATVGRDFLGYDPTRKRLDNGASDQLSIRGARLRGAWANSSDPSDPLNTQGYTLDSIPNTTLYTDVSAGDATQALPVVGLDQSSDGLVDADLAGNVGSRKRLVLPIKNMTPQEARALIEKLREGRPLGRRDAPVSKSPDAIANAAVRGPDDQPWWARRDSASKEKLGRVVNPDDLNTAQSDDSTAIPIPAVEAEEKRTEAQSANGSARKQSKIRPLDRSTEAAETSAKEKTAGFDVDAIVPSMSFDNCSLDSAVERLTDAVGCDILVDASSLHSAGYGCDSTLSVTTQEAPLADALTTILTTCSGDGEPLDFVATQDGLLITTQSAAQRMLGLQTLTYSVADFFAVEDLPTVVREDTVNAELPPNWRMGAFLVELADENALSHAGRVRSSVLLAGDRVTITQSPAFHRSLAGWLSGLRTARFESQSTALDVYRLAARIRSGLAGADDVIALLDVFPADRLARLLLDAMLGGHADIVGPPPSLDVVMASAADELDAAALRSKRIATCLDAPLLGLMAGNSPTAMKRGKAGSALRVGPDGVTVSVLLADSRGATIAAIEDAGLQVESVVAAANVVVGEIPLSRLADLSVLPTVRWVEATR